MTLPTTSPTFAPPPTPAPLPRSRIGAAALVLSIAGFLFPVGMIGLLLAKVPISPAAAHLTVITTIVLGSVAIVCSAATLFDRRHDRLMGFIAWWVCMGSWSAIGWAIRLALHQRPIHF